jgi:hypothetical protein
VYDVINFHFNSRSKLLKTEFFFKLPHSKFVWLASCAFAFNLLRNVIFSFSTQILPYFGICLVVAFYKFWDVPGGCYDSTFLFENA